MGTGVNTAMLFSSPSAAPVPSQRFIERCIRVNTAMFFNSPSAAPVPSQRFIHHDVYLVTKCTQQNLCL